MDRIEQLLALHRRGVLRRAELVTQLIGLSSELSVAGIISAISPDVIEELQNAVYSAPRSEDEWDWSLFIVAGTHACSPTEASDLAKARYRSGIERLREYFATGRQNA
jgi:hypothetical protein